MQNNWDESLEDVVHAINTSKQGSTKYTPFFLMFNRHPVTPEVLNSKVVSETDCFESDILNVDMDTRIAEVTALQAKVRDHIEKAQGKQKSRKRKNVKSFHIHEGEEVLKANKRKEGRKGGRLEGNWTGPFLVKDITGKGVATLADKSGNILRQKTNVSQLKPYLRRDINLDDVKGNIHDDHDYCLKTDMAGGDASRTEIVQFSVDRFHILELEEEIYMRILSEETNRKRPLIQFPRCQATVEDFETLCPQKKSFPWLNDDILDTRIAQLCKAHGGTALQVHTFVLWWRSFTNTKHVDDSHISCLKDLDDNDMVLIPRIVGGQSPEKGNHFILWVLDGLRNQIRVYDPIGNYKSIPEMDLAILCNAFRNTWDVGKWTVEYPEQWRLSDSNNCGVLVCTMAEMEVRDKWTSMKNEVIEGEDLWYLRRYHASSMAAYVVQHMTYTRTVEEVGKKGICSIVSDTEIQDLFQGIVKGSLKPTWNKWWQTKTGKMAKAKSFHPALSAHVEELLGHIDNIVFTKKKDEKLEHFELIMSELIPEVSLIILRRTEGFSHFWAEISYLVECVIKMA
ncbi:hypothetical protein R3I94_005135 [Phoxinus phoxinus]